MSTYLLAKTLTNFNSKMASYPPRVDEHNDRLICWDYTEVLKVHESLQYVNETINTLGLVPQGL